MFMLAYYNIIDDIYTALITMLVVFNEAMIKNDDIF